MRSKERTAYEEGGAGREQQETAEWKTVLRLARQASQDS